VTTGERIKEARKAAGLTQEQLGNMIGVKKAAINKYETGIVSDLKQSIIKSLSEALNVSPCYLLDGADSLSLSFHERALIKAYRSANETTQENICAILGISAQKKDFGQSVI